MPAVRPITTDEKTSLKQIQATQVTKGHGEDLTARHDDLQSVRFVLCVLACKPKRGTRALTNPSIERNTVGDCASELEFLLQLLQLIVPLPSTFDGPEQFIHLLSLAL